MHVAVKNELRAQIEVASGNQRGTAASRKGHTRLTKFSWEILFGILASPKREGGAVGAALRNPHGIEFLLSKEEPERARRYCSSRPSRQFWLKGGAALRRAWTRTKTASYRKAPTAMRIPKRKMKQHLKRLGLRRTARLEHRGAGAKR